ncbi:PAS domain S-box-containing protein [Malonomonas rubra DSM 5091]|uniref:PAS domain S-box-containing protein n=1 Tax=Malonomonas rubra DSM 5091 TaxID=1122189 RepID=A0A1M6MP89_MALRU|nr:PAS domain S-box protein [Malonomonas rubra]SHJ85267.1 PAS domain S-box-containing protein [Malonomonas rubra DSM 5091]
MLDDVILQLDEGLEDFLLRWAEHLRQLGYFKLTFATRDESIRAFYALLKALKELGRLEQMPHLKQLRENSSCSEFFLQAAREQRARGSRLEMSLGCFKAMRLALEDMISGMVLFDAAKLQALTLIRRYFDLVEAIIVADWEATDKAQNLALLEQANRKLARDKNTYESIFESTSNLVLITDGDGTVREANPEARVFFSGRQLIGSFCGELLGLPGEDLNALLSQTEPNRQHEVSLTSDGFNRVFNLQIKPLSHISISLSGVMLILSDITCIVDHRQLLEQRVDERTRALANSEKMLDAVFQSVGKGILLIDSDREIVKANQQASEIYGIPLEVLIGTPFCSLIDHQGCMAMNDICQNLLDGQRQRVEVTSIYVDGKTFPTDIIISSMKLDGKQFWPVIVRDITEQRALEDGLRAEKLQSEEMNVTLRNVLKSIESDRQEAEQNLSHRIRSSLLPGLEKVRKEKNADVRSSYLNMLSEQLVSLTTGFEKELDGDLLKLSKTELKICRFIKSGLTGKEICEAMNLSFETIQTHRKNIRKKLGLSGKTVNLHTFLANRNVDLGGLEGDR